MESFHWDEHYTTGLTDVDMQHHHLVDIINRLGSMITLDKLVYSDLEQIMHELVEYTQYHFQEEESLMDQMDLDQRHVNSHIKSHQDFLHEVTLMNEAMNPDQPQSSRYLLEFLINWLAYHILGQDQEMAHQIKKIADGTTPDDAYDQEQTSRDNATEALLVALNNLFEQVSSRNRELVELNRSLETIVVQRTEELSEANEHLEILASTDMLTDLPNRRHAMQAVDNAWNEQVKTGKPLAVLMIDADHFKEVNDVYGHDSGDLVLKRLAYTLKHTVRTDDLVCRLGGDEFFVICPNTDREGALYTGELLRNAVASLRVKTGDCFWDASVSIGVAVTSDTTESYEALIKEADNAVYAAKNAGKNCVRISEG